jgi:fused signal recognition particle receptor
MFQFIKQKLQKIYHNVTSQLMSLFAKKEIDRSTLKELERILIQADTGVATTRSIMSTLQKQFQDGTIQAGGDLKEALQTELSNLLEQLNYTAYDNPIYLLIGINGSGKTTCAGKLAYRFQQQGKRVLLVAADTFRAAAVDQLHAWADKIGVDIITGDEKSDPTSVVYKGCQRYREQDYDILIIDTAGRLQTKTNLMRELEKIGRVVHKQLPDQAISTLLVVDAMLGQNSLDQAKLFHESTQLNGIILTKMDGTGKGGIVFAIADALHVPVAYISYGEQVEQLKTFDKTEYVTNIIDNA